MVDVHVEKLKPSPAPPPGPNWVAWTATWLAFIAGIAASLTANVAHAEPTPGARLTAGWAPLALLLVVEVMIHVPAPRFWLLAGARYLGTFLVAVVAAIASYRHMKGLALDYGEDMMTASTLPLSADGLVVVASIGLLTLADLRRRAMIAPAVPLPVPLGEPVPLPVPPVHPVPLPVPLPSPVVPAVPWPRRGDDPLPAGVVSVLGRLDDETRQLYVRAYQAILAAGKEGRALTGREVGSLCARGERWGRDRIAEMRSAQHPEQKPLADSAPLKLLKGTP